MTARPPQGRDELDADAWLCASWRDAERALALDKGPVILLEHGAGQHYASRRPENPGSPERSRLALVLHPSSRSAETDEAVGVRTAVVGSPVLDDLREIPRGTGIGRPVVAVTHHWDCRVSPEARGGRDHWWPAFKSLARSGRWHVAAHAHPRDMFAVRKRASIAGIPFLDTFEDVVRWADVLVCDNSSVMYEWAALDRPVVVLDNPWYRCDADLWPRFWDCADVGVRSGRPDALDGAVAQALADPPDVAERRRDIVARVYDRSIGAAKIAADEVRRIAG